MPGVGKRGGAGVGSGGGAVGGGRVVGVFRFGKSMRASAANPA